MLLNNEVVHVLQLSIPQATLAGASLALTIEQR